MNQLWNSLLLLSAAGGLLTLLLLALKPLTRRLFGSKWQYYIWLSVLIVMILPVRVPSPFGTIPEFFLPQGQPVVSEPAASPAGTDTGNPPNAPVPSTPAPSGSRVRNLPSIPVLQFLPYLWLCGALLFAGCGLVSYWRFLAAVRKNSHAVSCPELEKVRAKMRVKKKIAVKTTQLLAAPLMAGIFKPVLLLPERPLSERELHNILLHELTHYKRKDLWYKWFAFAVNALHWFNPFIYLAVRQINEECELSCDLSVTRNMTEEEKVGYMTTIVNLTAGQKGGI